MVDKPVGVAACFSRMDRHRIGRPAQTRRCASPIRTPGRQGIVSRLDVGVRLMLVIRAGVQEMRRQFCSPEHEVVKTCQRDGSSNVLKEDKQATIEACPAAMPRCRTSASASRRRASRSGHALGRCWVNSAGDAVSVNPLRGGRTHPNSRAFLFERAALVRARCIE